MARLIDADAVANGIANYLATNAYLNDTAQGALEMVHDWLTNSPVMEVIRCKDCQHSEPCKPYNKVWCPKMGRYMKQDGFCSEGVKKDG